MTRLLDGIRVIDAANFIAGPVSTTIMADFGADVIKVEPPTGDVYRVRGAGYPPSLYNYPWIVDNRTKRSVAIDLRTQDGQKLLHHLVKETDVFVTNAPLDSRARLRVRYCLCRTPSGAGSQADPRQQFRGRMEDQERSRRDCVSGIAAGDEPATAELPPEPSRRDVHHALFPVSQPGADRLAQRAFRDARAGEEHGADDRPCLSDRRSRRACGD